MKQRKPLTHFVNSTDDVVSVFRSESGLDPLVQVLEVLITSELNMNQAAPGNTHLPMFEWLSVDVHECKTPVRLL